MSVVAISSRPHPSKAFRRSVDPRPSTPGGALVTVTVDIDLGADTPGPQVSRLLELLGELTTSGDGEVTVTGAARRLLPARPGAGLPTAILADLEPAQPPSGDDRLVIQAASRVVRMGSRTVPLTRIEFDLLLFLAENPRRVFTRLQLLTNVWGYRHAIPRTVDVHVRRLRAKVGDDVPLVTTVYGVGYRLADDAPVTVDANH